MRKILYPNQAEIKERIQQYAGIKLYSKVELVEDTTQFMNVYRGQVLRLDLGEYFILGEVNEPRFGMQDTPKFWVKKAIDLDTGITKIIKLVFHEEFLAHIGPIKIRCYRNPEKEAKVLEVTQDDDRFMHGISTEDYKGNNVRIIDYIYGDPLYDVLMGLKVPHEEYFHTMFPDVLRNLVDCMKAIGRLHERGLCHGDVRNDHIFIEKGTELYRWIDFDLTQDFTDYDIWSFGNVLWFATGMGNSNTFSAVAKSERFSDNVRRSLNSDDASAFFRYRIINLRKLYSYIPKRLNNLLMRFSVNTTQFYDTIDQMIGDVEEIIDADLSPV